MNLNDGPVANGFADIHFIHNSIPELDMDEIDLSCFFLGRKLSYPLIINAMTGGTDQAREINFELALIAARFNLAMAVGSQTIAVNDPDLRESFKVVRDANPGGVIIANVGAGSEISTALHAVEMIHADALQLHFNVPQELAMAEGDRRFKGIIDKVGQIVKECPVPVIAKETGFGFSRETVTRLYAAGVRFFDCGGQGGSNFIAIENQRGGKFNGELDEWGIPTVHSLAETISLQLTLIIIASGGIRTALDAAKALAMGADMTAMAAPLLKVLLQQGIEELEQYLHEFFYRLQAVLLMTGSKNLDELRRQPLLILGDTAQRLRLRNIDPSNWASR